MTEHDLKEQLKNLDRLEQRLLDSTEWSALEPEEQRRLEDIRRERDRYLKLLEQQRDEKPEEARRR